MQIVFFILLNKVNNKYMNAIFKFNFLVLMNCFICYSSFCQKPFVANIRVNIENEMISKGTELWINRGDMGTDGKGFKKVKISSPLSNIKITTVEPYFCDAEIRENGVLIQATFGSMIITNENIELIFSKNLKFGVAKGKEVDYFSNNRFLLFEKPAVIVNNPAYNCSMFNDIYEISTEDIRLKYSLEEFEMNIIEIVKSHNTYYTVLQQLFNKVECISLKTLEICYNLFDKSIRETRLGGLLKDYIKNKISTFKGARLPVFNLYNLKDSLVISESLLSKKKTYLIDFWASWCGPCLIEMRKMKSYYEKIDTSKFEIISVSLDTDMQSWERVQKNEGFRWDGFLAKGGWTGDVARKFALTFIPQNKLVDSSGRIIKSNLTSDSLYKYILQNGFLK